MDGRNAIANSLPGSTAVYGWSGKTFQMLRTVSQLETLESHLYNLGMAWAAVFLTYGDMSMTASLIASIMMGTIIGTRILESTRSALARISWFGSCKFWVLLLKLFLESGTE